MDELLDRVRSVAPEFSTDFMLRISGDSKLGLSKDERVELVEEAFRLGAQAQMPWPVGGRGYHTDTRPGWREFASETGLNSLQLQTRAIEAMRFLDSGRLRRMFSELRPLNLQPGTCKDPQRPKLAPYYTTMLTVAKYGFSAREKSDGLPERWMAENLAGIVSPSQLSGAMQANRKPSDAILNALAGALPNIHHDWLGFLYADGDLPYSVHTARPVRDYIVRSLTGPRCVVPGTMRMVGTLPVSASWFNLVIKADPKLQVEPIDPDEIKPSRSEETYVLEQFWTSAKSQQVMAELRWLNHGNRNLPDSQRFWTLEERQTSEWNERYLALLKLMEGWTEHDEPSRTDYFHMRAHTYGVLTRLTPPGTQRTNALRNFISWLNLSYNDRLPHAEWFTHARQLVQRSQGEPWLLDELELHGNAVLRLYAGFQRRTPAPR